MLLMSAGVCLLLHAGDQEPVELSSEKEEERAVAELEAAGHTVSEDPPVPEQETPEVRGKASCDVLTVDTDESFFIAARCVHVQSTLGWLSQTKEACSGGSLQLRPASCMTYPPADGSPCGVVPCAGHGR